MPEVSWCTPMPEEGYNTRADEILSWCVPQHTPRVPHTFAFISTPSSLVEPKVPRDRQRNARPKPRTTVVVVWRTDTQLPVPKRRPHTHPSRRKPMPQCAAHLCMHLHTLEPSRAHSAIADRIGYASVRRAYSPLHRHHTRGSCGVPPSDSLPCPPAHWPHTLIIGVRVTWQAATAPRGDTLGGAGRPRPDLGRQQRRDSRGG